MDTGLELLNEGEDAGRELGEEIGKDRAFERISSASELLGKLIRSDDALPNNF